ncbi:MAG: 4Fe-4S cluster-binding domain-containing protein [bacterium]|nr:4Fe-4S cluster-binding domain-containing protein [bacterium]
MSEKYDIDKKIKKMENEIIELRKECNYWSKEVEDLATLTMHKMRGPFISFEYHLADHCNLNCKGCDHFSPLAEKKFTDFDKFSNDIHRMSELFNGKARSIHILGGEPLLHKEICKFMKETRKAFPDNNLTEIRVISNGILVNDMNEEFWKCLHDNNIILSVTKYPLKLDYDLMVKKAREFDATFEFYDNTDKDQVWYNIKIQEDGKNEARKSFYKCFVANDCVMLKDGKLYTCTLIPNIEHFNKFFNKNLEVCKDDCIDIYEARSKEEIFDFLSKPVPFCRFCNPDIKDYSLSWEATKKDINEWL